MEWYHINRNFTSVDIDIEGTPPVDILDLESARLTEIVRGEPVTLYTNANETYVIEKEAIAIGYSNTTAEAVWNAAVGALQEVRQYPGEIREHVGWVRGTRSEGDKWGAYLWAAQNKITFKSSETDWWISPSYGVPVKITNVLVGTLGDYGSMTTNVDVGPYLSAATNAFPGTNQAEDKHYRVDITNVFYELIVPDIWITPRDAAAMVEGDSVQFAVTGTNILQGVTWSLSPTNFEGCAAIQYSTAWQADVSPGNVVTNYKVRATSVDSTNFYDEVMLTVLKVDIVETNIYMAVTNTTALHLTSDSSTNVQWEITPTVQAGASIVGSSIGASIVFNAGSVPTNYTVRAYAVDYTNCYDTCTVTVVKVDMEIYRPKVIDPAESVIPADSEMTTGSVTFVNLDNDDNDSKFDYNGTGTHDDVVAGGDDELVKVKLKIQPNNITQGQVKLLATAGAGNIAVWTNNNKSASSSYTLGTMLNIPDDLAVEGDSLVKTLWVEGVSAQTVQKGTTLKTEYTVGGTTCDDAAALTVVGVDQILWQGKANSVSDTSTLDADPNWPSGLTPNAVRVFPDARVVGGSVEADPRDKADVEVTLTVEPPQEIKIYLKSFDMDDPTSATTPVDDEASEEDNRGTSPAKAGQFIGETNGVKELVFPVNVKIMNCDFQVTMQPGDNFRVVANGDKDFLAQLENKDSVQDVGANESEKNANKQRICNKDMTGTPAEREIRIAGDYAADTLTVWRFLHVEVDSMTAPPTTGDEKNTVNGNVTAVEGNGSIAQQVSLSVNLKTGLTPQDNSENLSSTTNNGRFENGWVQIGSGSGTPGETTTTNLLGNGDDYVRKDSGIDIPARVSKTGESDVDGKVIAWSGSTFTLSVSSGTLSTNYNGGILNVAGVTTTVYTVSTNGGVNTITVPAPPTIPFVIHDDDDDSILPRLPNVEQVIYALAEVFVSPQYDVGDTNTAVAFIRNVPLVVGDILAAQDWDSKAQNADRYWVGYVLSCFQGAVSIRDRDPNTEDTGFGVTPDGAGGCLIYLEVHRSGEGVVSPVAEEQDTIVHELGHALGRGVAEPVTDGSSRYLPASLNDIRNATRPWP